MLTWFGCTSCFASSATRFLKSAVNRRRLVIIPCLPQGLEYTLADCLK